MIVKIMGRVGRVMSMVRLCSNNFSSSKPYKMATKKKAGRPRKPAKKKAAKLKTVVFDYPTNSGSEKSGMAVSSEDVDLAHDKALQKITGFKKGEFETSEEFRIRTKTYFIQQARPETPEDCIKLISLFINRFERADQNRIIAMTLSKMNEARQTSIDRAKRDMQTITRELNDASEVMEGFQNIRNGGLEKLHMNTGL